jgi:O-antigen ligase
MFLFALNYIINNPLASAGYNNNIFEFIINKLSGSIDSSRVIPTDFHSDIINLALMFGLFPTLIYLSLLIYITYIYMYGKNVKYSSKMIGPLLLSFIIFFIIESVNFAGLYIFILNFFLIAYLSHYNEKNSCNYSG